MNRVSKSIVVEASPEQCYQIWQNFENLPKFMRYVTDIRPLGEPGLWCWEVKGPIGRRIYWETRVDVMEPCQRIAWHNVSLNEGDFAATVTFTPLAPERTRVHYELELNPPGGIVGELMTRLFVHPDQVAEEDLQDFKRLAEVEQALATVRHDIQRGSAREPRPDD
jgi:uncharacterized membrane protein